MVLRGTSRFTVYSCEAVPLTTLLNGFTSVGLPLYGTLFLSADTDTRVTKHT